MKNHWSQSKSQLHLIRQIKLMTPRFRRVYDLEPDRSIKPEPYQLHSYRNVLSSKSLLMIFRTASQLSVFDWTQQAGLLIRWNISSGNSSQLLTVWFMNHDSYCSFRRPSSHFDGSMEYLDINDLLEVPNWRIKQMAMVFYMVPGALFVLEEVQQSIENRWGWASMTLHFSTGRWLTILGSWVWTHPTPLLLRHEHALDDLFFDSQLWTLHLSFG